MDIGSICDDSGLGSASPADRTSTGQQSRKADVEAWCVREAAYLETRLPLESGNGSASGTLSTSLMTSHVANAASDKLTPTDSVIDAEPEQFAHFFSTVNVVRWVCNLVTLKSHVQNVHPKISKEEIEHMVPKQKQEAHKKDYFLAQRCSYPGCTSQQVFGTRYQYGRHLRTCV